MATDEQPSRDSDKGDDRRPQNSSGRPPRSGDGRPRRDGGGRPDRSCEGRPPRSSDSRGEGAPRRPSSSAGTRDGASYSRGGAAPTGRSGDRPYRATGSDGGQSRPARSGDGRSARSGDGRPARSGDGRPARSGAPRGDVRSSSGRPKLYGERGERPTDRPRQFVDAPPIPDEIEYGQLDREVRARLRTLSKENAEDVGRHLIMAGLLVDDDPELAYRHAVVAVARGGRVDVVREAGALTAYATGRYAEALREFRTVRRLNGSSEHVALMADCERGLGRPERAIALAHEVKPGDLDDHGRVELAIVVAGARLDMGDSESAILTLSRLSTSNDALRARIAEAMADTLRSLGRDAEADEIAASIPPVTEEDEGDDVVVYDVATEDLPPAEPSHGAPEAAALESTDAEVDGSGAANRVPAEQEKSS